MARRRQLRDSCQGILGGTLEAGDGVFGSGLDRALLGGVAVLLHDAVVPITSDGANNISLEAFVSVPNFCGAVVESAWVVVSADGAEPITITLDAAAPEVPATVDTPSGIGSLCSTEIALRPVAVPITLTGPTVEFEVSDIVVFAQDKSGPFAYEVGNPDCTLSGGTFSLNRQ